MAQSYALFPGKTVRGSVGADKITEPEIWARNNATSSVTLAYELVLNTLNADWYAYICDNQICYASVINDAVMAPLAPGDSLLVFKLTCIPQGVSDTGRVIYAVWDESTPADTQWVSFIFDILTDRPDVADESWAEIGPVPADHYLRIALPGAAAEMKLVDQQGKIWQQGSMQGKGEIDTRNLPAGLYFLHLQSDKGVLTRKILVQH